MDEPGNHLVSRLGGDRRLTFEQLRVFVTVASDGGFGKAGELLHRSQSAISQNLQRLEDILGYRLVIRRQGHIDGLTQEGQRFLGYARDILARMEDAVQAICRPGLRGRVRLGVTEDFAVAELHGVVSRCLDRNPDLQIEITSTLSNRITEQLDSQQLDIAIFKRIVQADAPDHDCRILRSDPLHWLYHRRVAIDHFESVPLVGFPDGCIYREAALRALDAAGRPWFFAYTSASYHNVRGAIAAGLGVGFLPQPPLKNAPPTLTADEGFPPLPEIQLAICQRATDEVTAQVASYIINGYRPTP
ncbi:LysR substrate-binding domain-containing protein [Acidihalobacter prosperus]|uniref:HTH lysR-type domain-containing protein n=1 Tax=Acidihalobacter prosperus TaxID=160660 RepID=A0A1A6C4N5_9GAMM|nr:LysR substrate-binding domain-containing protein [Acidihalobacter prosperus]OBS09510.1 hypothetical protein Thpro_021838 [Acidihalobacter prosperus]